MELSESTASLGAAMAARLAFIGTGTGTAYVRVYDGTRPASANDAASGTLLTQIALDDPVGTLAGGLITLAPLEPALVLATGSPAWARVVNRNGDAAFDVDAGGPGSGKPFTVSAATVMAGGLVTLTSAVLG